MRMTHAAGVANGGTTCEDPPGIREGGMGNIIWLICVIRRAADHRTLKRIG